MDVGKVLEAGVHRHHPAAQPGHAHREHADVGAQICNVLAITIGLCNAKTATLLLQLPFDNETIGKEASLIIVMKNLFSLLFLPPK